MTRFETIIVASVAVGIAALHAPVWGQDVRIDVRGDSKPQDAKGKPTKGSKKTPSQPAPPPPPKEPTFLATGDFCSTKEKARESAVRAAVDKLRDHLAQESPPITLKLSERDATKLVRKMLLTDKETVVEQEIDSTPSESEAELGTKTKKETMYKMTVAVCVEPQQIRELRSDSRAREALWVLAGLGGFAAMIALFFRIDSWTKGYLTSWLMLGTVGTAALLGGLWWMAK